MPILIFRLRERTSIEKTGCNRVSPDHCFLSSGARFPYPFPPVSPVFRRCKFQQGKPYVGILSLYPGMMSTSRQNESLPMPSMPKPASESSEDHGPTASTDADRMSNYASSRSGSTSDAEGVPRLNQRPNLLTRKSSGTIIVHINDPIVELHHENYDEGDARTMSPRRSSEEVERLEEGARHTMIECVASFSLLLQYTNISVDKRKHYKRVF